MPIRIQVFTLMKALLVSESVQYSHTVQPCLAAFCTFIQRRLLSTLLAALHH